MSVEVRRVPRSRYMQEFGCGHCSRTGIRLNGHNTATQQWHKQPAPIVKLSKTVSKAVETVENCVETVENCVESYQNCRNCVETVSKAVETDENCAESCRICWKMLCLVPGFVPLR